MLKIGGVSELICDVSTRERVLLIKICDRDLRLVLGLLVESSIRRVALHVGVVVSLAVVICWDVKRVGIVLLGLLAIGKVMRHSTCSRLRLEEL